MPNPSRRLLVVLMDRSGSMASVADDAEGGLASLLLEQKANPAETHVSLYDFADSHGIVYEYVALADVPAYQLKPCGNTALRDAIGITLTRVSDHIDQMPEGEQPAQIEVVIQTDGKENWSHTYSRSEIYGLITAKRADGWKIAFVGADQDALAAATDLGIDPEMTLSYASKNTKETLTRAGRMLSRGGGGFTQDDRNATRY